VMLKFIKPILLPFTAALLVTGCDSSLSTDNTDEIDINLAARGIDLIAATANPGAVAEMPKFFLPTDQFVYSNWTYTRAPSEITPLPIIPLKIASATINSAGELRVDNLTHTWKRRESDPNIGSFSLGPQHVWPLSDRNKVDVFQENMDNVIAVAAGSSGSVNQALNNQINSSTSGILTDASDSIGHYTEVGPEAWINGALQPYVLMEREVTYTVTSSNQDLLDFGTVSGTFEVMDRYGLITLLSVGAIGADAVFDQITLLHVDNPFFLFSLFHIENGDFTLTIN